MEQEFCYICDKAELKTEEELESGMCSFCAQAEEIGHAVAKKHKEQKPQKGVWV